MKVFVTLGTQGNQFPRCLKMIDELIEQYDLKDEFVVQVGNTKYYSDRMTLLEYVPESRFKEMIGDADVIISHAGSGALFSAIKKNKKTIAVARLHQYNEMTNDHQTELVKKLTEEGYILDGTYSIIEAWKQLKDFKPRICDLECTMQDEIEKMIDKWLDK